MVGGQSVRIVRTWTDPRSPTGEGERYETEDGRVWKPASPFQSPLTGESPGTIRGDRIYPR